MAKPTITVSSSSAKADNGLSALEDSRYDFKASSYPLEGLGTSDIPSYIIFYVNLPDAEKYNAKDSGVLFTGGDAVSNENIQYSRKSNQAIRNGALAGSGGTGIETISDVVKNPGESLRTVLGAVKGNLKKVEKLGEKLVDTGASAGVGTVVGLVAETITSRPRYKRIKEAIAIYMPDTIFHTYAHDYNTMSITDIMGDIGLAQRGIDSGVATAKDLLGSISGEDEKANRKSISSQNAGGTELLGRLAEASGKLGAGAKDLMLRSKHMAVNPQVELVYKATGNRSFVYEFKFQPSSQSEAANIHNIITTFRKYAAPDLAGDTGSYFIPPGQFDIEYRFLNEQNPYIGRLSTCVLENIAINYSSAGQFATFDDGMPVEISLQLTFKEVDIITRGMVERGF